MRALSVIDLGLAPYTEVQTLQGTLRRRVAAGEIPGVLLLLEHPPVITLGSRGGRADVLSLDPMGEAVLRAGLRIPVVRSERGGAATLHAPGQLVSYPLLPIPGRDLRRFVRDLEEVLMRLLAGYDIVAERRPGAPGLYVAGIKICSAGLRCERWVASHGTSLNVAIDLSLFDLIVSCGEADLRQTSILELTGRAPPMSEVKAAYAAAFATVMGRRLLPAVSVPPDCVEAALTATER